MNGDCRKRLAWAFAVALGLSGCASDGPAPVEDHSLNAGTSRPRPAASAPKRATAPGGTYRVQRGDTLYSIAFRHGVDYRDLADWNGIAPPYTIYPGRELRLSSSRATAKPRVAEAAPPPKPAAPPPAPSNVPKPAPFEPVASSPPSANAGTPSRVGSPAPLPPVASPTPPPPEPPAAANGDIAWRWPADGQVVGTYVGGDPMRQGIDIAGKAGAPVKAAADGTVVYSGNGLIGYGELIIVKHSPAFLSAYGHNQKRLVQEGDKVKAGQTIAEMGSSGASRDELHFEIRKNGKPSNPIDYLPRR
ncbi:MAG TPA: peptidoglycan DD-metalloendopeptidase family protein [Rhodanobacteraceae bacterium]|nr:peptidoglycan DD-metalloendopeptidase family protein [Rhodanobacteraceae bacterium]